MNLKQVITYKTERIDKINSKLTMIVPDNKTNIQEQLILKETEEPIST